MKENETKKAEILVSFGFSPMSEESDNLAYVLNGKVEFINTDESPTLMRNRILKEYANEVSINKVSDSDSDDTVVSVLDMIDSEIENVEPVMRVEQLDEMVSLPILRRLTVDGNRYYFEKDGEEVYIYASGTTLVRDGFVPKGDFLNKWRNEQILLGHDPDAYAALRADFGTAMHFLFGLYLLGEDIRLTKAFVGNLISKPELKIDAANREKIKSEMLTEMMEDLISFAKFCSDYKVKPLAVEQILRSRKYMVASPLDLICEMQIEQKGFWGEVYKTDSGGHKKGEPKESKKLVPVNAIIDFKSSRGGTFYPEHKLQLELYRRLVDEVYGDALKIEKLFNFSPKAWSATTQYHLKDQLDMSEDFQALADAVFAQGRINHKTKVRTVQGIGGTLSFGKEFNIENYMKSSSLEDELQKAIF